WGRSTPSSPASAPRDDRFLLVPPLLPLDGGWSVPPPLARGSQEGGQLSRSLASASPHRAPPHPIPPPRGGREHVSSPGAKAGVGEEVLGSALMICPA